MTALLLLMIVAFVLVVAVVVYIALKKPNPQPTIVQTTSPSTVGHTATASGAVVVVDVRMPFWSMVIFMVKWSIAAIPALIILAVVTALVTVVLWGAFGGLLVALMK